jgi:uncharacterized protein with HEPN domain
MNLRDLQSLLDIFQSAEIVITYIKGVSRERFAADEMLQDAVIRRLLVIGEAAGRVSEEGQNTLPNIEWTKIRGLRNRLIHEYDDISLEVVWDISQTEMTDLISKIEPVIPPDDHDDQLFLLR